MINIFNDVFTHVKARVVAAHRGTDVSTPYGRKKAVFPAVVLSHKSNTVVTRYRTRNIENASRMMIEAQIGSNKANGKEEEAWKIAETVDEAFAEIGFTRIMCEPVEDFSDATIYRIVCRYEAIVDKDFWIYHN